MTRLFFRWTLFGALLIWLVSSATAASAGLCGSVSYQGLGYTVCTVDVRRDRLALFSRDTAGHPFATFERLGDSLAKAHRTLVFAMNAGMFEPDLSPVGLLVEGGRTLHPANVRDGSGNFYLKPNGVFFFGPDRVGVEETGAFLAGRLHPEFATQSGPMLVVDGKIHPRLQPNGTSLKIRNGVGAKNAYTAVFAISDTPVSFFQFASLFRDKLECRNALFLDGTISTLDQPEFGRTGQLSPLTNGGRDERRALT